METILRGKGFFVIDSLEKTHTYGVTVYQVWSWVNPSFPASPVGIEATTLEYETSSKSKANAVCEYLTLKAEQADLDEFRQPDMKGTIVPSSINC